MNDEPCPSDVTCNVCGSTSQLCTVSSGVAPVSYQLCLRCTEVRAEALSVVGVWIASYGTLEHVPDHSKNLVTFLEGSTLAGLKSKRISYKMRSQSGSPWPRSLNCLMIGELPTDSSKQNLAE